MNKKIKAAWLKALRSGKYKQGREALNKNGEFCCLGILCEIAVKKKITKSFDNAINRIISYGQQGNDSYLPPSVVEWAGLEERDPWVKYGDRELTLSELNDELQLSFKQIANVIERRL